MSEHPAVVPADRPAAPRRAAVALLGASLFAAVVVPDVPWGVNLTLVALLVTAAALLADPVDLDRVVLAYGAGAILLALAPAYRAAEWVVALDLLAAAGLGALAVTRAVGWAQIVRAPGRVVAKLGPAAGFVLRPLKPREGALGRLGPVLRGAVIGAVLVVIFGALFSSADRAFAEIAGDVLVPDLDLSLLPARILVLGGTLLAGGAFILAGRRYASAPATDGAPSSRWLSPVEWMTALGLLDLLFLGFVLVQIAVLFGGHRYVLETAGVTYAENARQGFFQLLTVGALTLGVFAATARWARRDRPRDEWLLRALLGGLGVLTLVVLASALRRINLYEDAFGLTALRLSAQAAIVWMAAVFGLLLVAGIVQRTSWLPGAVVGVTAVGLLLFSLVNPEGIVAERNVERFEVTGRFDLDYAQSLSADAAPALAALPADLRCAALAPVALRLSSDDPILGWNASRERARDVVRDLCFPGGSVAAEGS